MTKSIFLTQGKIALVDDEDFEELNKYKWCFDGQYAQRRIGKTTLRMHKVIIETPPGKHIDHIDGNPLNNQRSNLRVCSHAENQMNRKKSDGLSSKYKGVSWHKQTEKWRATIKINQGLMYLGLFEVEEDAARAYDEAAKEHFGEFAKVNL